MSYKLSIEDHVGRREIHLEGDNGLSFAASYNPNAKLRDMSFENDHHFDNSASIVPSLRKVAAYVAAIGSSVTYDNDSVNEEQQALFENILAQEYQKNTPKPKDQGMKVLRSPGVLDSRASDAYADICASGIEGGEYTLG